MSINASSVRISVIVPVFNQSGYLAECLEALSQQKLSSDQFEVIIVDNGSDEPPKDLVASYAFASFAAESKPGSYAARNKGLQLARGEVLAFTDSDCKPEPQWLQAALDALDQHERVDVVAGRIEVECENPSHPTTIELYDIARRFDQRRRVALSNGVVTANMITYRGVFNKIGPFDDSLMSGGDLVWSARAAEHGFNVKYIHEAVVIHPARTSLALVLQQSRRNIHGRYDIQSGGKRLSFFDKVRIGLTRLLPQFRGTQQARLRLHRRGYGWWAWIRVVLMFQVVHYAGLFQIIRRSLGQKSERR